MKEWFKQLGTLTLVNLYGYFREPAIIFWALVFPAGIAGVLGVAFQGRPPQIPIAIVWAERPAAEAGSKRPASLPSREMLQWKKALEQNSQLQAGNLSIQIASPQQAALMIRRGEIQLYAEIETNLDLYRESQTPVPGSVRAHYDPNNPEGRLAMLSLERALGRIASGSAGPSLAGLESVPLQEIGGRYIDFLIPGLLALGIMNSCMWGVGYGLIDLRVKKLLRRMAASPMYKSAFLGSHFVARMAFTLSEALILFVFAHLLFGVTVQGSLPALLLLFFCGNIAWSGIAILGSSRAISMHAANGIVNAVTLPLTMLSGIFFSYRNFPDWSQPIIEWLPLTVLADSIRSVFIEGAGLATVLLPALVLALVGIAMAGLGLKIYRWH